MRRGERAVGITLLSGSPGRELSWFWLRCVAPGLMKCEERALVINARGGLTDSPSFVSSPTQNRLRGDLEAAQLGHRAEEGRDGHRAQEHAREDGVQSAHRPGHGEDGVPAGLIQPH